jgi:hypothetical protein
MFMAVYTRGSRKDLQAGNFKVFAAIFGWVFVGCHS